MAAIHVGVGHQNDLVVAGPGDVEGFFVILGLIAILAPAPDPGPEGHDQHPDLFARQHLIEAGFLDIQDLSLERQDRLELPVAPHLGRAAR